MPFRRIVVATDFSRPSLEAANLARTLGESQASFLLLHVLPGAVHSPFISRADEGLLVEAARVREEEARSKLRALASDLGLRDAELEVRSGSVGAEVARVSEAFGADLISVGARGLSTVERLLLGSKARQVLHAADGTVLVGRGHAELGPGGGKVLVTSDFQPPAQHAGERARAVAEATGAELLAAHVVDPAVWGSVMSMPVEAVGTEPGGYVSSQWVASTMAKSLHQFNEAVLGGMARELLPRGEPVGEIRKLVEAENVDLLVVGSHGPGAVERALIGSVAEALAERASCSVLVVRERP